MATTLSEAAIACIKLMLSRPSAVDELASVMMKTPTLLTTQGISIKDVKQAITVISESDYWQTHVLKHGCGSKARRFLFTVVDQDEVSQESELEIGFTEDERPQVSNTKKSRRKKAARVSADSSASSGDQSMAPSHASPIPKRRRILKKKNQTAVGSSSSDHSQLSDNSHVSHATPKPDPTDEASLPKRTPASYSFTGGAKENIRPTAPPASPKPASRPNPKPKPRPRPQAATRPQPPPSYTIPPIPVASPDAPVGADWSSEFGQIVKQALTWRSDRFPCPFRALGLSATTSNLAEVKKRWSKLILLLHPDKSPQEWRGVKALSDAAQAVNEARAECERRLTASAISRPSRPEQGQCEVLDNNGSRVVEIRWQPPSDGHTVEKYTVLLRYPAIVTLASVNAGVYRWLAMSEVDPRYQQFFVSADRFLLHIHASNSAGLSEPLVVDVPLRAAENDQVERMFEGLKQLGQQDNSELGAALDRFTVEQLKSLLRSQGAARLSFPTPPPSGLGNKNVLVERLLTLLRSRKLSI